MLVGDTLFVTGGGQGIGEAIARRLVNEGARRVTLAGRTQASLDRVARDLRGMGAEVATALLDLQDVDNIRECVSAAQKAFGPISILANCAGVTDRGGIFDTTPEVFDRLFHTNVRGNFFLMQAALPAMVEQRRGVVVNISSMLAHGGLSHLLPYSATKAALNLITRNVAHSLRASRVRVHAINLGWTVTPAEHITQTQVHGFPDDWAEREGDKQPFGRLLTPQDAAGLCAFLASADAAMMTGTVIDLEQWVSGVLG